VEPASITAPSPISAPSRITTSSSITTSEPTVQACTTLLRPTVTRSPTCVPRASVAMWTVERGPSQNRSPRMTLCPSARMTASSPIQAWTPMRAAPITVLPRPHQTGRLAKSGWTPS
jgi:hypothetical protein